MDPSRNNQNQNLQNSGINFQQHSRMFHNQNQPLTANQQNEEEDQFLLDYQADDATGNIYVRKTPFKPNSNNINNNPIPIIQTNQSQGFQNAQQNFISNNQPTFNPINTVNLYENHSQTNQSLNTYQNIPLIQLSQNPLAQQQRKIRKDNALSRASKLDESLMQILKQYQNPPLNDIDSKGSSKIEQKSKKAAIRLSHQFFIKSGNPEENMKSKKKSRQTISTMHNLDYKRDFITQNTEEPKIHYQKDIFTKPSQAEIRAEKMEIQAQSIIQTYSNKKYLQNSPQKKSNDPDGIHRNRISEVKRKRERLSSGMEGLSKLLKAMGSDKKEKKVSPLSKSQPVSRENRVTMDMNSLLSFLQSKDDVQIKSAAESEKTYNLSVDSTISAQGQKQSYQTAEQIKHESKNINPLIKVSNTVILEEQNEDEITPIKQNPNDMAIEGQKSIKKIIFNEGKSKRKSFHQLGQQSERMAIQKHEKDYYTRQIFNHYFCNLKESIQQKRHQLQEMKRQRAKLSKEISSKLSEFTINAQQIVQWKDQEQKLRQNINRIKQKVVKAVYDRNSEVIYKFQQAFCIQLHRLQKTGTDDGFFIEFTYDDCMFRILRNSKKNETNTKFLQRFVQTKSTKLFQFSFEEKSNLIQIFNSRKTKNIKNLTAFMIEFTRYMKAIEKLELTLAHYANINLAKEFAFEENTTQMGFIFISGLRHQFFISLDLIELLENTGIRVFELNDGKNTELEIPEEVLKHENEGNKLVQCFIYLEKYVVQNFKKEIDLAAKRK